MAAGQPSSEIPDLRGPSPPPPPPFRTMTIYPLSGASWPAKQPASAALGDAAGGPGYGRKYLSPSRDTSGSPRQWELRRAASSPLLIDHAADYWSDASLSVLRPHHLASTSLPVATSEAAAAEEDEETEKHVSMSRLVAMRCSGEDTPPGQYEEEEEREDEEEEEAIISRRRGVRRGGAFPPPLDCPVLCEGSYSHLQTLEKVRFSCVRSKGRLLVTSAPIAGAQPAMRRLHSQRRDGRLQLWLHEGGSAQYGSEEEEEEEETKNTTATAEEQEEEEEEEEGAAAERQQNAAAAAAEEEEEEGGSRKKKVVVGLYTKVLRTLECDVVSDGSVEVVNNTNNNPIHVPLKSSACGGGVASFLHKSLTRVRPLNMLTIWQS